MRYQWKNKGIVYLVDCGANFLGVIKNPAKGHVTQIFSTRAIFQSKLLKGQLY